MKIITRVDEAVNAAIIPRGSRIYTSGNAATPKLLLNQLAEDENIKDVELLSVLLLGDVGKVFEPSVCERITHRVIFNSHHSRDVVNNGLARYQLMHLSDIPNQLEKYIRPNVVFLSVSGPDNGGNYSLGATVEGVFSAVKAAKEQNGIIIAERNKNMPFVLGTTIRKRHIDFLIDTDYELPKSPVKQPDEKARRIAKIIAAMYIEDGATLQYGIGEVPEAVSDAIIDKGLKNLGIHTELFADAMQKLVDAGSVSNKFLENPFGVASIFLSGSNEGYKWLHFNSSVQSRPCDYTNSILKIAAQPKMVAVNSAIGVDLHGNIWADSLLARKIYSGVGGQSDFLRGAYLSDGGHPIIAMKASTEKGVSKIMDECPKGITTTAIAADPVIIITEHGAFDPRGLSLAEHAVGIAHLADPDHRENLLRLIYDSGAYHKPKSALSEGRPKGFTPYETV